MKSKLTKWFLVTFILGLLLLSLGTVRLWFKTAILREDWARFEIPPNSPRLNCRIRAHAEMMSVCNHGIGPMEEVLVRINATYLFPISRLEPAECKQVPKTAFATTDWRRIHAVDHLKVTTAELTASVEGKKGYCVVLTR
jgi:hypothetical protein